MVWYWSWVLLVGVLTLVGGAVASRLCRGSAQARPPASASRLLFGVSLAALAFVLCLPGRFPFSSGQQLGYGVLLGLLAAVLATIVARAARPSSEHASRVAAAAAAGGAAVMWVAITGIVFHGDPVYALLGGIVGGLLTILPAAWEREEIELKVFGSALLLAGLGSLLAVARYQLAPERPFWMLPTMPLASGLLGMVVGSLLLGRGRAARWEGAVFAIALEAVALFGSRALLQRHDHIALTSQFTVLLLLGWAAVVLAAAASRFDDGRPFARIAPALLTVTALIIAFNVAGGYGAAFALAAGLPVALALWRESSDGASPVPLPWREEGGGAPFWAIGLGTLFLSYRLYLADFEDSFRGGLTLEFGRHYVFVGLAAGLLWMGSARLANRTTGGLIAQLAGLALLPPVLFAVFGYEGLLGLVLGLWIAQLILPIWVAGEWNRPAAGFLMPLATIWALIIPNWAEFMLDEPRWVRGLIIGGAAAALLIVLAFIRQKPASPAGPAASAAGG